MNIFTEEKAKQQQKSKSREVFFFQLRKGKSRKGFVNKRKRQEKKTGIWRQELKQRPWGNCSLLVCFLTSPAQGQQHPQCVGLSYINQPGKCPHTCLHANLTGAFFSVEIPPPQITLTCVKI